MNKRQPETIYAYKHRHYLALWNSNPAIRFAMTAFISPFLASNTAIWIYSGLDFYLPNKVGRADFDNGMMVLLGTMVSCIVIGWPVMLVIMMPFIKALRRRGKAKFVYFICAGLLIGWVLAALVFPVFLGRSDTKALYYPTIMTGGLTMFLAWMFYIVGDPQFPHVPPNGSPHGYAKTVRPK